MFRGERFLMRSCECAPQCHAPRAARVHRVHGLVRGVRVTRTLPGNKRVSDKGFMFFDRINMIYMIFGVWDGSEVGK